jgi:hypothetical protein
MKIQEQRDIYQIQVREAIDEFNNAKAAKRIVQKAMTDILENNEQYKEAQTKVKSEKIHLEIAKNNVLQNPNARSTQDRLEVKNAALKEAKQKLSDALNVYIVEKGTVGLEAPTGTYVEIQRSFSIKPNQLSLFE